MAHDHLIQVICGTSGAGLAGTLALAGLVGSAAHCVGMCGPFVLAQIAPAPGLPATARLIRAATIPYHLGRATTYAALGAVMGGAGGALAVAADLAPLFRVFLLIAAALFLLQAVKGFLPAAAFLPPRLMARAGGALARIAAPLFGGGTLRGYLLGVALGFLPCGLLYGALVAAAGAGGMLAGAFAMAAFAAGTVPSLVLLGCGASALATRWRRAAQAMLAPFQAATAVALVVLAIGV
jgi:uncharacterized protein